MNPERNNKARFIMTLKWLRIIHLALMTGMVVLVIIAFYLQPGPLISAPGSDSPYVYLVPALSLAGYFCGLFIFKWLLKPLSPERDLALRLTRYQSASLLQYSCLEIPALVALFAYIEEGHVFYAAIALLLLLYLFTLRPTQAKMLRKVPMSFQEKEGLVD
jgi:hypothetical protein